MVTTRPPKTIVKPTALGPVANTDTKLLIYGLFQKGRVLAQDGNRMRTPSPTYDEAICTTERGISVLGPSPGRPKGNPCGPLRPNPFNVTMLYGEDEG